MSPGGRTTGSVVERWIRGSAVVGLASVVLGAYALAYRASGFCSVPEKCDVPAVGNHHPYTAIGYALVALGCAARFVAVALRHRVAPLGPPNGERDATRGRARRSVRRRGPAGDRRASRPCDLTLAEGPTRIRAVTRSR